MKARGAPADAEAFLVGHAGLLDVDIDILHRIRHTRRLVHQPAGIGVGDQHVAGLSFGNGVDAGNIGIGVAAYLELELGIALGPIASDLARHLGRALLADRAVEQEIVAVATAEQVTTGWLVALAENVPARDIDCWTSRKGWPRSAASIRSFRMPRFRGRGPIPGADFLRPVRALFGIGRQIGRPPADRLHRSR